MDPRERAAHEYADLGWPVFCCRPGEKAPDTPHGFKDATTNHARIERWWRERHDRNVAIATGAASIDVLDVDVRADGSGFPAFNRAHAAGLLTGFSHAVTTPSGGLHLYFPGSAQGGGSLPGQHLDFKAQGGYVLAPPSSVAGRLYRLDVERPGPHAPLNWPEVKRLFSPPPRVPTVGTPSREQSGLGIDHLVRHVQRQVDGSRNRNNGLFWAACRAVEEGLDLRPLAEAALGNGLSATEIARTLASARRATAPTAGPGGPTGAAAARTPHEPPPAAPPQPPRGTRGHPRTPRVVRRR